MRADRPSLQFQHFSCHSKCYFAHLPLICTDLTGKNQHLVTHTIYAPKTKNKSLLQCILSGGLKKQAGQAADSRHRRASWNRFSLLYLWQVANLLPEKGGAWVVKPRASTASHLVNKSKLICHTFSGESVNRKCQVSQPPGGWLGLRELETIWMIKGERRREVQATVWSTDKKDYYSMWCRLPRYDAMQFF